MIAVQAFFGYNRFSVRNAKGERLGFSCMDIILKITEELKVEKWQGAAAVKLIDE